MRRTALLVVTILLGYRHAFAQVPGGPTIPSSFSTPAAASPAGFTRAVPGQTMPATGSLPRGFSQAAGNPQPDAAAQPAEEVAENIHSFDQMSALLTWAHKHWQVVVG